MRVLYLRASRSAFGQRQSTWCNLHSPEEPIVPRSKMNYAAHIEFLISVARRRIFHARCLPQVIISLYISLAQNSSAAPRLRFLWWPAAIVTRAAFSLWNPRLAAFSNASPSLWLETDQILINWHSGGISILTRSSWTDCLSIRVSFPVATTSLRVACEGETRDHKKVNSHNSLYISCERWTRWVMSYGPQWSWIKKIMLCSYKSNESPPQCTVEFVFFFVEAHL